MRSRRDPFARVEYRPVYQTALRGCTWCGNTERRIYSIREESDGGRATTLRGQFDSWSCAESYHDKRIGR
jgi:hypothetical protein